MPVTSSLVPLPPTSSASPHALLPPPAALAVQDPYRFLKVPPFAGVNLIMMRGGRSGISNTGAFYIQAASRRGPVAWMLEEMVVRNLL